jgi:hypothetical protein
MTSPTWLDLQEQIDWYRRGVEVNALTVPDYIDAVRGLLEIYEEALNARLDR